MLSLWTKEQSLLSSLLSRVCLLFRQSMKKRWWIHWMFTECILGFFEAPSPRSKPKHEASSRSSHSSSSPPPYKLHSFSLLNYDKERLERKVNVCVFLLVLKEKALFSDQACLTACRIQKESTGSPVWPHTATERGDAQTAVAEGPAGTSVSSHAQW